MKMKKMFLVLALVMTVPFSGWAIERVDGVEPGLSGNDSYRIRLTQASWDGGSSFQEEDNPFKFHIAAVSLYSFDEDLNDVVGSPIWGFDAGFIYWMGGMGFGLCGQYFTASGSGNVDDVDLDIDFSYLNIIFTIQSLFIESDSISVYAATGLGYSNAKLDGKAEVSLPFPMKDDIDTSDDGMIFMVGLGIEGPWVFGEIRYSESSYNEGTNEEGENVTTVIDGMQVLIGVRTP
jgi:hypothetical protein